MIMLTNRLCMYGPHEMLVYHHLNDDKCKRRNMFTVTFSMWIKSVICLIHFRKTRLNCITFLFLRNIFLFYLANVRVTLGDSNAATCTACVCSGIFRIGEVCEVKAGGCGTWLLNWKDIEKLQHLICSNTVVQHKGYLLG